MLVGRSRHYFLTYCYAANFPTFFNIKDYY